MPRQDPNGYCLTRFNSKTGELEQYRGPGTEPQIAARRIVGILRDVSFVFPMDGDRSVKLDRARRDLLRQVTSFDGAVLTVVKAQGAEVGHDLGPSGEGWECSNCRCTWLYLDQALATPCKGNGKG